MGAHFAQCLKPKAHAFSTLRFLDPRIEERGYRSQLTNECEGPIARLRSDNARNSGRGKVSERLLRRYDQIAPKYQMLPKGGWRNNELWPRICRKTIRFQIRLSDSVHFISTRLARFSRFGKYNKFS